MFEPMGSLLSWTSLFGVLLLAVNALVLWRNAVTVKRTDLNATSDEWRKNAQAYEERVKVLEVRDTERARELFDLTIKMEDVDRTNRRIGRHNLAMQRQVDQLQRREKQLVGALRSAGIAVPEPEPEDD